MPTLDEGSFNYIRNIKFRSEQQHGFEPRFPPHHKDYYQQLDVFTKMFLTQADDIRKELMNYGTHVAKMSQSAIVEIAKIDTVRTKIINLMEQKIKTEESSDAAEQTGAMITEQTSAMQTQVFSQVPQCFINLLDNDPRKTLLS